MKTILTIAIIYIILATTIVGLLLRVRSNTLANDSSPQAQADWNQWRAAAAEQTGEAGPVQRTPPSSAEPPLLVLMRDHFAAAIFGLLAPATALYLFFAWIVTGVIKQSRSQPAVSVRH